MTFATGSRSSSGRWDVREGDAAFQALRSAIADVASSDADDLIAEARALARAKVRDLLAQAMADAMLDAASGVAAPPADAAPGAPVAATPKPPAEEHGWYVFGVVRAGAYDLPAGVSLCEADGVAAVVRDVALSEYGEEPLREHLEDIAWLEEAARRHETVLDALAQLTTVIPLRLCTIYRSEEAVRDMLRAERAELREALGRLAGRTEWGVKAFRAAPVAEAEAEVGSVSGEAYMQRRRAEAVERRRSEQRADAEVDEAFARLSELAVEALANPLQSRELSGRSEEMVLNGVFLVEDAGAERFRAAVHALDAASPLSFELTGPWPPYNFVKRSVEAAR